MESINDNFVRFMFDDNPIEIIGRKMDYNDNGWFLLDKDDETICFIRICDYRYSHFVIYPHIDDEGITTCFYFTRIGEG